MTITVNCYLVSGKGKVKLKGRYNEPIYSWLTIRKIITEWLSPENRFRRQKAWLL